MKKINLSDKQKKMLKFGGISLVILGAGFGAFYYWDKQYNDGKIFGKKSSGTGTNETTGGTTTIFDNLGLTTKSTFLTSATNTELKKLQAIFNAVLSLNLTLDGVYGKNTQNAFDLFLKKINLSETDFNKFYELFKTELKITSQYQFIVLIYMLYSQSGMSLNYTNIKKAIDQHKTRGSDAPTTVKDINTDYFDAMQ